MKLQMFVNLESVSTSPAEILRFTLDRNASERLDL